MTVPRMPVSEIRVLEPLPKITNFLLMLFSVWTNSSVVVVIMKVSAGPPILTVV